MTNMNMETPGRMNAADTLVRDTETAFAADEHIAATQILVSMIDPDRLTVVQVAGPTGGEGVSTVALSLARSVSETTNVDVCLASIDHDGGRGLQNAERVPQPSDIEGGPLPTAGVIRRELPRGLIRRLRAGGLAHEFDSLPQSVRLVLLETPSLLRSAEAGALSGHVDGTIVICESEHTKYGEMREAMETIERVHGKVLGVLLNKRRYRVPPILARLLGVKHGQHGPGLGTALALAVLLLLAGAAYLWKAGAVSDLSETPSVETLSTAPGEAARD